MRVIGWLIGIVSLLGSGGYLFVYIVRWQWNRALFSGIAMITVLLVMGVAMILRRLGDLQDRLDQQPSDHAFRQDLQDTRPQRDHFAWLAESPNQLNVFVTVLLGGGAVASGLAWAIGKIAESTTTPQAERTLADRMGPLAFPDAGLRPGSEPGLDDATRLLRAPTGRLR